MIKIIRGTTHPFEFKLDYNKSEVASVHVIFSQSHNSGLNKSEPLPMTKRYERRVTDDDIAIVPHPWSWIDNNTLCVQLDQEETLTFSDKYKAKVQLRGQTVDGVVFATLPEEIVVYPVYDEEIFINDDGLVILDGGSIVDGDMAGDTVIMDAGVAR